MSKVKITSEGLGLNTRVFVDDVELTNVTGLFFKPIKPEGQLEVILTVLVDEVELNHCNALVTEAPAEIVEARTYGEQSEEPFFQMMRILSEYTDRGRK